MMVAIVVEHSQPWAQYHTSIVCTHGYMYMYIGGIALPFRANRVRLVLHVEVDVSTLARC